MGQSAVKRLASWGLATAGDVLSVSVEWSTVGWKSLSGAVHSVPGRVRLRRHALQKLVRLDIEGHSQLGQAL